MLEELSNDCNFFEGKKVERVGSAILILRKKSSSKGPRKSFSYKNETMDSGHFKTKGRWKVVLLPRVNDRS